MYDISSSTLHACLRPCTLHACPHPQSMLVPIHTACLSSPTLHACPHPHCMLVLIHTACLSSPTLHACPHPHCMLVLIHTACLWGHFATHVKMTSCTHKTFKLWHCTFQSFHYKTILIFTFIDILKATKQHRHTQTHQRLQLQQENKVLFHYFK